LGRIFDLYFTTKERGTGIGLSMVYRIIQLHDGEIEVQSTPGRGTTFRVLLPRAQGM
jgi:signal transduction histidine kinase